MKRSVVAGLALAVLAASATTAHATPNYHYTGGCGFTVINDTTPGGQLGGRDVWNGKVNILAVATNERLGTPAPTASIDVECELRVNGNPQGTLLTASGIGVAVNVNLTQFTAYRWASIELCEKVTVQGEVHNKCHLATDADVPPQVIQDSFWLLYYIVKSDVLSYLDPTMCPLIGAGAPGIPGILDVDPSGDVFLFGESIYDCPPYTGNRPYDPFVVFMSA